MKNSFNVNVCFLRGNYLRLILILFLCLFFNTVNAQQKVISGTVVDNLGLPVPGANVIIKGTNTGVQTDFDGNFTIKASPTSILIFSYIGIKDTAILVGDQTKIRVILESDSEALDEIIVVGYGTQKKSDVISSVASVKSEDLVKVATSDIGEMLRGKVAGVQVTLNDGGPGSSSSIQIRGKKSINGSNEPIVIADGVVIGSINDINANDIASMEILKDAASQAIYGARASNGVILITTKRGKTGKPRVSYSGFSGIQTLNRNFDIYSGAEYAQLKREAFRTSNGGVYRPDEQIFTALELASVQSGEYINWENEILNTGTTQNHNLSVSSGSENTNVFTSFNYIDIKGVIPNSDYQKVTARANVDQRVNKWLKIGLNTSFQFSESNDPNNSGILLNSITTSPLGQIYNEDGSYRWLPGGLEENKNPLIDIYETSTNNNSRNDIINIFMDISPFTNFNYRLNSSRRSWNGKTVSYNTAKSLSGIANAGQGGGSINFQDNVEYQLENILSYNFNILEKNHFGVTGIHSVTESKYNDFTNNATRLPNDILGIYGLEAATLNTPSIGGNRKALVSFAGRVEYDFDNKYYFTVSARADASSVFGTENKWGFFPAVNAGWNVHKESFLDNLPEINNLKLRVSYGKVGNQPQNAYQSLASASQRDYIINGIKVSGYVPGSALSNPGLKWETSTQLNAAIDLGLFKNRVQATVEFYNTRTTDLLIYESLNANTGYSSKLSNLGEVENQGIEATLNTAIIRNKDFKFNVGLTFTKNTNKIISIYGKDENGDGIEDDAVGNNWFIGKPIDVYYQYKAIGIFQEGENIAGSAQPLALPGDIKLYDADPTDGIINPNADRIITSKMPDWFGTLSLSMEYKGFDFSADVTTVQGVTKDNSFLYGYLTGGSLRAIKNGIKQNYWTPENPGGDFPRPRDGNDPDNIYFKGLQDASYVRLQNISLGFTMPSNWISSLGLSNVRLYLTGSNLLTLTDFQSYSPEKSPGEYPEAVSFVTGLQIGF